MSFLRELKRRNVYRVAALYIVVSWVILQVADVFTSFMPLPEWTGRLVFLLLLIGFPVALVFAWAFELTPEGLKREGRSAEPASPRQGRWRRIDMLIFTVFVVAVGLFAWMYQQKSPEVNDPRTIQSIVVLPLENLMNDPGQAYFVTGMHDALITELSKIESLRVISRTSAERFEDTDLSIPEIAGRLGVDAVVEGSVLRADDTVRIAVQLIEASSDRHLWSAKFDRQLSDILALYSDVTRRIADQVRVTLTADEKARIDASETVNPAVYELYLQGRYLCDNWSPTEMKRGVELLQRAVDTDPDNAAAHAHLALCLQYSAFFGYERPLDIYVRSKTAAENAVLLDEDLAEGHVAMAGVQYYLEFRPKDALASLNRALELNPSSVRALLHASWLLGESGRKDEALERNRRALSLDPYSVVVNHAVGQIHYLSREFDQAIVEYEKTLLLDPNDPSLHYFLAWPLEQKGKLSEAINRYQRAIELSENSLLYHAALGHAYGLAGEREMARRELEMLRRNPDAAPYELALVHLGLGNVEQSIDWLEKAYDVRDSHLIYINRDAKFDPLRNNPRFVKLLERFDFPAAQANASATQR
jgi:serine/threonine-protein kinase